MQQFLQSIKNARRQSCYSPPADGHFCLFLLSSNTFGIHCQSCHQQFPRFFLEANQFIPIAAFYGGNQFLPDFLVGNECRFGILVISQMVNSSKLFSADCMQSFRFCQHKFASSAQPEKRCCSDSQSDPLQRLISKECLLRL